MHHCIHNECPYVSGGQTFESYIREWSFLCGAATWFTGLVIDRTRDAAKDAEWETFYVYFSHQGPRQGMENIFLTYIIYCNWNLQCPHLQWRDILNFISKNALFTKIIALKDNSCFFNDLRQSLHSTIKDLITWLVFYKVNPVFLYSVCLNLTVFRPTKE